MTSLVLLAGVGLAIALEASASPRSLISSSHDSDPILRTVALCASLLLLGATAYAALRTQELFAAVPAAVLVALGGWLRAAAMRNLGDQFRTEAGADHLVTTGIHTVMRHPSELGLLCWTLGLLLAAPSVVAGTLALAQVPLLIIRLRFEEAALAHRFPKSWPQYASRTPRFGV